jgi:hypothetical protein
MAKKPKQTAPKVGTALGTFWVALNPNTYPDLLTVSEQYHVEEDGVDNWIQATDLQGRNHMMLESQLTAQYRLDTAEPEIVPEPEEPASE